MPTAGESTFGHSTQYQEAMARSFYSAYSKRHPPKHRVGLLAREEAFMEQLRQTRNTKGFSEAFPTRRRFPIIATEPDDSFVEPVPASDTS